MNEPPQGQGGSAADMDGDALILQSGHRPRLRQLIANPEVIPIPKRLQPTTLDIAVSKLPGDSPVLQLSGGDRHPAWKRAQEFF